MGKSSSDDGKKAAKAGLCACGICCALCIGIPLLIIIIVIIIIVVAVGSAADSLSEVCDDGACDYDYDYSSSSSSSSYNSDGCLNYERDDGDCFDNDGCLGARTCSYVTYTCGGSSGC